MDMWREQMVGVLRLWAGQPASELEFATAVLLGLLVAWAVHSKVSRAVRARATGGARSAIAVFGGLVLALLVAAAGKVYLTPILRDAALQQWIPVFCPLIAGLILVVPLSALLHRMNYFEALFTVALSLAAAVAVGFLVHGAFEAASQGADEFRKTKGRTDGINSVL